MRIVASAPLMLALLTAVADDAPQPAEGREGGGWRPLFDGKALGRWKPTRFGGEGDVEVVRGVIKIPMGADLSGITWDGEFPRVNYEIELEARRVDGNDFFCGLTFPVGKDPCSFIVGGWGGSVVGLSNIDGEDAAHNETTQVKAFDTGRWYAVKVRVTPERIECFLDGQQVVDQARAGRAISIRESVAPCMPLGIATYATVAELRNIRWRPVPAGAERPAK
jgi:hypothetical protein